MYYIFVICIIPPVDQYGIRWYTVVYRPFDIQGDTMGSRWKWCLQQSLSALGFHMTETWKRTRLWMFMGHMGKNHGFQSMLI